MFSDTSAESISFIRLIQKFKNKQLYETSKFSVNKVLYSITNLLPIKDILKTLPFNGLNNYIEQGRTLISTSSTNRWFAFIEPCLVAIKIFANNWKLCVKKDVKMRLGP